MLDIEHCTLDSFRPITLATVMVQRQYTLCPKKRPTLSFAVILTCLHQSGQNLAYKKKKLRATKRT